MSLANEKIVALRGLVLPPRFDRRGSAYSGKIAVQIPVVVRREVQGVGINIAATLHLQVTVLDRLTRRQRQARLFPPNMICEEEWPFSFRLTAREAVPNFLEKKAGVMLDDGRFHYAGRRTTVELEVFALHGVSIVAKAGLNPRALDPFDPLTQDFGDITVKVSIVRLCAQDQVPPVGEAIQRDVMLPLYEEQGAARPGVPDVATHFLVQHKPTGVEITWLPTRQVLSLTFSDPADGNQGFAFFFNENPQMTVGSGFLRYDDLLHVWVAGKVDVKVTNPVSPAEGVELSRDVARVVGLHAAHYASGFTGKPGEGSRQFIDPLALDAFIVACEHGVRDFDRPALTRDVAESRFFRVQEVESVAQLPPHGAPVPIRRDLDIAGKHYDAWRRRGETLGEALTKAGIDIAIGFVPFVGDAADYAEFNYAMATGKDRWGRPVARWEVALIGLSALPLLGSAFAIARGARRVLQALL